jgi:hypothetical protein
MSFGLTKLIWLAESLKEPELLLLALALADYANDDGTSIFPSVGTLAKKTRRGARTVQRNLRHLESRGIIETVRYKRGGRGKAREYRIVLSKLGAPTPRGSEEKHRHTQTKRATSNARCGDGAVSPHLLDKPTNNRSMARKRTWSQGLHSQTSAYNGTEATEEAWSKRIRQWWSSGSRAGPWLDSVWGLPPDEPGTLAPRELVRTIAGQDLLEHVLD